MLKKLFTLSLIVIIIFLNINLEQSITTFKEKINIRLKNDEQAIVFLIEKNSISLLIKNEEINILLHLFGEKLLLKETLIKFNIEKLDYLLIRNEIITDISYKTKIYFNNTIEIEDFSFIINDLIEIKFNNYVVSIYDENLLNNKKIEIEADFLYILNGESNLHFEIVGEMESIIYNEAVRFSNKFLEYIYLKYIDTYQVTSYDYLIIKFNYDNYDIISIPISKN